MKPKKVNYQFGRNDIFDYYIIDEKENAKEIELDKNTLAYKIGGEGKAKVSVYANIVFGNFDYVLEVCKKSGEYCGLTLASKDEII